MPISAERLFLAEDRLRPIWRFFLSTFGVLLAISATDVILDALPQNLAEVSPYLTRSFLERPIFLLTLLALFKFLVAVLDRKTLGTVGVKFHSRWGREFGHGVALGALMVLVVAVLELALGLARFRVSILSAGRALSGAVFYAFMFGVAASNEELVFRGYPFQRLTEAITPSGAVAGISVLFGVAHLHNAHHTWLSTANTALVGIPLAIAYLRTRSLWMPIGLHFIWNFLLAFVLGLPVSGITFPQSLLSAQVRGPAWLTGADYGPEGSVLTTFVYLGATIYLLLEKRIYVSEDMRVLLWGVSPSGQPPEVTGLTSAPHAERAPDSPSEER